MQYTREHGQAREWRVCVLTVCVYFCSTFYNGTREEPGTSTQGERDPGTLTQGERDPRSCRRNAPRIFVFLQELLVWCQRDAKRDLLVSFCFPPRALAKSHLPVIRLQGACYKVIRHMALGEEKNRRILTQLPCLFFQKSNP